MFAPLTFPRLVRIDRDLRGVLKRLAFALNQSTFARAVIEYRILDFRRRVLDGVKPVAIGVDVYGVLYSGR